MQIWVYDAVPGPSSNATDYTYRVIPNGHGRVIKMNATLSHDSGSALVFNDISDQWGQSLERTLDQKADAWKRLADL